MAGFISQTSGTLSLSTIQTVMGGANPISMSEYYKNGSYVPSTKSVSTYVPSSGYFNFSSGGYYWRTTAASTGGYPASQTGGDFLLQWAGVNIVNMTTSIAADLTTYTTGGFTYERGGYYSEDLAYTPGGYGQSTTYYTYTHYQLRRLQVTSTTINASVPTSGPISISNFYQTEKP